jgi:ATP-dependent Clp protease ATP-binding subunit ClpA
MLATTRKELAEIAERAGLEVYGTRQYCTEGLMQCIARAAFDARYGVRSLQRTIEQMVIAGLARFLLEHPEDRGRTIQADVIGDEVVFRQA